MKLKKIATTFFTTLLISPAFAIPTTGVTECDQLFKEMTACIKPTLKAAEEKQFNDVINGMAAQIKKMIDDGSITKAEAVENCALSREQLREEGCK